MKKYLFICLLLLSQYGYTIPDFLRGFEANKNKEIFNKIYTSYGTMPGFLYEYSDGLYYSLSRVGSAVGHYNLKVLDKDRHGWSLTPWPYRLKLQGEGLSWEVRNELQPPYGPDEPKLSLTAQEIDQSSYDLDSNRNFVGCFSKAPLRYGDFDSDGQSELVLFLNNDLVVFSPQKEKIIFSTSLSYKDELPADEVDFVFGDDRDDLNYQYYSQQGVFRPLFAPYAASRSYAKVFIDHFAGKDTFDIIVWRKLYQSRLNTDPVKGFKHEADALIHYQRDATGEYLPQDTSPETIQNWLSAKNLTWQKGFPSTSECVGEEGKLIPEMHDPLLNDPDVLK